MKAILADPAFPRYINEEAVAGYFALSYIPAPLSIVQGVRKLEPGYRILIASKEGVRLSRYWDLEWAPDYGRSEAEFLEELRERLEESVRLHMVSDVPLGAFLSGGVDSSSIVADDEQGAFNAC